MPVLTMTGTTDTDPLVALLDAHEAHVRASEAVCLHRDKARCVHGQHVEHARREIVAHVDALRAALQRAAQRDQHALAERLRATPTPNPED